MNRLHDPLCSALSIGEQFCDCEASAAEPPLPTDSEMLDWLLARHLNVALRRDVREFLSARQAIISAMQAEKGKR